MNTIRVSVQGSLNGGVALTAVHKLIEARADLRRQVRREFPRTPIAQIFAEWRELRSIRASIDWRLNESSGDFEVDTDPANLQKYDALVAIRKKTPRRVLIMQEIAGHIEDLVRVARATRADGPQIPDNYWELSDDERINVFGSDYCRQREFTTWEVFEEVESLALSFGELSESRRNVRRSSSKGGRAKADQQAIEREKTRLKIAAILNQEPTLSSGKIAEKLIHGEESEFGYRYLADIASKERRRMALSDKRIVLAKPHVTLGDTHK
jgi:hypothetical protein